MKAFHVWTNSNAAGEMIFSLVEIKNRKLLRVVKDNIPNRDELEALTKEMNLIRSSARFMEVYTSAEPV